MRRGSSSRTWSLMPECQTRYPRGPFIAYANHCPCLLRCVFSGDSTSKSHKTTRKTSKRVRFGKHGTSNSLISCVRIHVYGRERSLRPKVVGVKNRVHLIHVLAIMDTHSDSRAIRAFRIWHCDTLAWEVALFCGTG
ncbi:hypothetical protein L596_009813 [Steinernema carpocapsae]|uniref:Uncharacterized protein n=1 Tax=Steinernema carpocapsae TaxID=34508 RepID=A0A4U5PH94_STECR|nr:hypothetical protein L596_009813 [Steinernema carpocapsae]